MKKLVVIIIFLCALVSAGGCAPMSKTLEKIKGQDGVFAVIETSKGDILLELYYKQTPLTVTNFVGLAEGTLDAAKKKPFYNGLKFHRVISVANGNGQDFMIQGGDPKGNGTGGPGYRFPDEILSSLKFTKAGILAMANSGPGTNGSQFFITIIPTPWLDGKHTIFGHVIEGQKIVDNLREGEVMKKITIIRQGKEAKAFTATQADFDSLNKDVQARLEVEAKAEKAAMKKHLDEQFKGYTVTDNGIRYKTLKEATGNKIGKGKAVKVKYKGYLLDGTVFDDSDFHDPISFMTNSGRMIKGFDLMVQDMKLNEKRSIVLPPEFAYGAAGAAGVIPPNAYICFDLEVIEAK
ncbi:MAG: peptidylprolyl isomerase [Treponema sp.]|jgi:cyclophilin family peptidyl-prolyl cis-trans isomerase|nr:peptidylprolyl isomerase [Treponema sp.]